MTLASPTSSQPIALQSLLPNARVIS